MTVGTCQCGCFVQVAFEPSELQLAGGSPPLKQQESDGDVLERMFEVLYLDDRVRVVNFIKKDDPPVLFVFERIAAEEDVEEESGTAGSLGEVRSSQPAYLYTCRLPQCSSRKLVHHAHQSEGVVSCRVDAIPIGRRGGARRGAKEGPVCWIWWTWQEHGRLGGDCSGSNCIALKGIKVCMHWALGGTMHRPLQPTKAVY